jgi:hypothetical protein
MMGWSLIVRRVVLCWRACNVFQLRPNFHFDILSFEQDLLATARRTAVLNCY